MLNQQSYYKIYLIDTTGTTSNGNYAELDCEGIELVNTFQVADIADISTRKDQISQTITFKGTKNNNIVFGNLSNLNRTVDPSVNLSFLFNFSITQDIPCLVYENDTQIFKGNLHFVAVQKDKDNNLTYDCIIKGYLVQFFGDINNSFISDLDFTPFNHTFNIANIKNSWSNNYYLNGSLVTGTTGQGYVYPFIDYGVEITNNPAFDNQIDYRNFRPAFYLREYFNKIFTQSGLTNSYRYTITGSTDFVDQFNNIIIPNNDASFSYELGAEIIFEVQRVGLVDQYAGSNQTFHDPTFNRTQYNHLLGFTNTLTGSTGQSIVSTAVTNGQIFNFTTGINTTINANVNIQLIQVFPDPSSTCNVKFVCLYRSNGNAEFDAISESAISYKPTGIGLVFNPPATLSLSVSNNFTDGSQMAFVVYLDSSDAGKYEVKVFDADAQIGSLSSTSDVEINLNNQAVLIGQNTQTITQVDFLKSIIQMFNLYVYPDPDDSRHIIFMPYNDYYSNFTLGNITNTAIDWTNKLDNSSIKQTPTTEIFDLYQFNFAADTDYLSKVYSDRWGLTYGNLSLTGATYGSNKSIDLIFGSTPVNYYNGKNYPQMWTLDTNGLKKLAVTKPRALFYNGIKPCPTYEVGFLSIDSNTGLYSFASLDLPNVANYTFSEYAEANEYTQTSSGDFIDIVWTTPNQVYYTTGGIINNSSKKTLYDYYYADQIEELLDSNTRIITAPVWLNENDIQNLDFRVPIYFDSVLGHNYFKLLSVEYSNKNQPATVTFQTTYLKDSETVFTGFKNVTYSNYYRSNLCSGLTGESVLYIVGANIYTSFSSQADADNQAIADANTNGQIYANTYGSCINTGVTFYLTESQYSTDVMSLTGITYISGGTGTGTTYYISSSGLSGNTGTTPLAPWPLSKVSSFSFIPGDSILFKKGDTLSGITNFTRSGSIGNPITFDLYGNVIANPVIDGSGGSNILFNITGSYISINNLVLQNVTNSIITLNTGVHDITINNCYINKGIRGINALHCGGNLSFTNNYFAQISDNSGHTSGGGNAIQLNTCGGSGIEIAYNKCYVPCTVNDPNNANLGVGDILSIFKSSGTSSSYILIHNNWIRGGGSTTFGFSGINPGDAGGIYQHCYNNIVINSGVAGIQVPGGTNIIVENNKIYGDMFPYAVMGINYYNDSGFPMSGNTVQNNLINWKSAYTSPAYNISNLNIDNPGSIPASTANGLTGGTILLNPSGWTTNTATGVSDPGAFDALLPNPLWSGTPYNILVANSAVTFSPYNTNTGNLNLNSVLFSAISGNTSKVGSAYFGDGVKYYYQTDTGAHIISSGMTVSLSAATYPWYFSSGNTNFLSCSLASNNKSTLQLLHITDGSPRSGTTIYYDSGRTNPVINGWYSDTGSAYETLTGVIYNIVSCS